MKRKKVITLSIIFIFAFAVGIPVGWYLLSPLWINIEVQEELPVVATPVVVEATKAMETVMAEPTKDEMKEPMPTTDMTVLAQGDFYPIAHASQGQATVYQLADGSHILRLQEFSVDNGPDLHVYLVPIDPVPDTVGSEIPGYVDLGKLKGNIGDQNYELPVDLDLSQFKSVVIWCQPFRVPFSAASLAVQ